MKKFFFLFFSVLLISIESAMAHCPLCTVGAAAVAGGAAIIGVKGIVIGMFIGAFSVSMGWWLSRIIKKQIIPHQKYALILISFLTTVLPLLPLLSSIEGFYVGIAGTYGSLLNRTYLIDMFLIGSIVGGFIVSAAPFISSKLTEFREGKMIPYQGIIITFSFLAIAGILFQIIL